MKISRSTFTLILAAFAICRASLAVTITEDFSSDPLQNGWAVFGDTNLFQWDSTNQVLDVTWDSSQTNSYFYLPLGTTLTMSDAFTLDFDIELMDIQWTNTFQIAVGLLNYSEATDPAFSRPSGYSPDIFEFNYFPDSGDSFSDPNIAASMTDETTAITNFPDFCFIYDDLPMNTGVTYHVTLSHAAGDVAMTATVLTNGQIYTTMPLSYSEPLGNFALDTLSISSYSGAGQDPDYAGSILAHGAVDNFVVTLPPPVRNLAGAINNCAWQAQFGTYDGWIYTLERSTDLVNWCVASAAMPGSGDVMNICDTNALAAQAFYRVCARQP